MEAIEDEVLQTAYLYSVGDDPDKWKIAFQGLVYSLEREI